LEPWRGRVQILSGTDKLIVQGDDDDDDEEKQAKSKGGLKDILFGAKKLFVTGESAAAKEKKKLNADIRAIKGGVDPSKQGRVKISIQWLTVPDEDDVAVQAMWDQAMTDPKNRKIVKRLVQAWSKEVMKKGFDGLVRSGEASKRARNKAETFYLERQLPRHWKAWAKRFKGRQASAKMAKYWNLRNRVEPSYWDWYLFSMENINMKRLAKGLAPRKPRDPGSQEPAQVGGGKSDDKKVFEGFGSKKSSKTSKSKGDASTKSSGKDARSQRTVM